MRVGRGLLYGLLLTALFLLAAGCAGAEAEEPASQGTPVSVLGQSWTGLSSEEAGDGFSLSARFQQENGTAITVGSVCLADEETSLCCALDETGEILVSGLPRAGTLTLTLLDSGQRELGRTTVQFSTGTVIDASTDENGAGYVTLKADTDQVSLLFTLHDSGTLQCSLRLAQAQDIQGSE